MPGSSNIDEIAAWLDGVIAGIDFALPGRDQSLGRDLAGVVAQGIADRSVPDARGPDAEDWAENREPYKAWKARKYDAYQPGILTGQMLSLESLMGETTVSSDTVEMKYGTNTPARSSRGGAAPPTAKSPPTDRQKAAWFAEGGRDFYGLDATIADACVAEAAEAVDHYLGGV